MDLVQRAQAILEGRMRQLSKLTAIEKANFTSTDLSTGGGLLAPQQARKLIALMRVQPGVLPVCTFIPMAGPTHRLDRMTFGSRILHTATEGTALDSSLQANPTGTKIELAAKEFVAEIPLTYQALEDCIMGRGEIEDSAFNDFLLNLIAERLAEDLEEIFINSDTSNSGLHADLKVFNGWLKDARDNATYNAAGAAISKSVFKGAYLTLPKQYRADKTNLRWFVPPNAEVEWIDEQGDKATAAGDQAVYGTSRPLPAYGIPMVVSGKMPEESGASSNLGEILLSHPKNLTAGIWRQIRMEVEKDARTRRLIIVCTVRIDCCFQQVEGTVLLTNVKIA